MSANPPDAPSGEEELPPGTTITDAAGDVTTVGPQGEDVQVPGAPPPPPPPVDTPISVVTASLPSAEVGDTYSEALASQGGTPPEAWTATGLPDGLTCTEAGVIGGTPTSSGQFSVGLTVEDADEEMASVTLQLVVAAAPAPPPAPATLEAGLYCTENPATVEALAATLKVNCTRMSLYCGGSNHTGIPSLPNTSLDFSIGVGNTTGSGATNTAEQIGAAVYAAGKRGTIYRIMWEFNSSGMSGAPWYVTADLTVAEYIAAFKAIATGLRAGDPTALIAYNGNLGGSLSALTECYPGSAYVDVVLIDYYDMSYRTSSTDSIMEQFLEWGVAQGKPTGFGEWGTYGSSPTKNNGSYMEFMAGVFTNKAYGVKYQWLFSNPGDDSTDITHWPEAEAAYIADIAPLSA